MLNLARLQPQLSTYIPCFLRTLYSTLELHYRVKIILFTAELKTRASNYKEKQGWFIFTPRLTRCLVRGYFQSRVQALTSGVYIIIHQTQLPLKIIQLLNTSGRFKIKFLSPHKKRPYTQNQKVMQRLTVTCSIT